MVCRYIRQLQLLKDANKDLDPTLPSLSAMLQAVENLQPVEAISAERSRCLKEVVERLEKGHV